MAGEGQEHEDGGEYEVYPARTLAANPSEAQNAASLLPRCLWPPVYLAGHQPCHPFMISPPLLGMSEGARSLAEPLLTWPSSGVRKQSWGCNVSTVGRVDSNPTPSPPITHQSREDWAGGRARPDLKEVPWVEMWTIWGCGYCGVFFKVAENCFFISYLKNWRPRFTSCEVGVWLWWLTYLVSTFVVSSACWPGRPLDLHIKHVDTSWLCTIAISWMSHETCLNWQVEAILVLFYFLEEGRVLWCGGVM